jgi:YD repeat-containing protein
MALASLAEALGRGPEVRERLLAEPAPEGGFTVAQLLDLARTNGLALEAVRRPAGMAVFTNYLAGGSFRVFSTGNDAAPEYKSGRMVVVGPGGVPQVGVGVRSGWGAYNSYGVQAGALTGPATNQTWLTNYFMDQRVDRYGRAVHYNYDATGQVPLLRTVVDVDGRTNILSYDNATFTNRITSVTDPYGRTAHFTYNSSGWLTSITDMAGMTSSFIYNDDGTISSMTTPYGPTFFDYFGGSASPGITVNTNSAVRVTEASGECQLFAFKFDDWSSYHWNRSQYAALSDQAVGDPAATFSAEDYGLAPVKTWLTQSFPELTPLSDTMASMAGPYDINLQCRPAQFSYTWQGASGGGIGSLKRLTSISLNGNLLVRIDRNTLGRPNAISRVIADELD